MPRTQIDGSQIKNGSIFQDIFGSKIINGGDISDDSILNDHVSLSAEIDASKIQVADVDNNFTGSKDFNIQMRNIAKSKGYKLNDNDSTSEA